MSDPVRLTFLGGLGEIGRNCATIEANGRMVILDCGQMFPDEMPGVDSVLPDFNWILDNLDRVDGCIVTHAHEDHIGGLPYLLEEAEIPLYGSAFTLGMIRHKLKWSNIKPPPMHVVADGDRIDIGPFGCEFIPVTHSTPSGLITAFTTPQGVILHSSDFKLDLTPIDGRTTGLTRIGAIADDPGIRLLLADSTNADSPGMSASESTIGPVLRQVFAEHTGRRIVVGSFSSHVHRLQQIMDAAVDTGRVVVPLGPSMIRNIALARELGLLRISDKSMAQPDDLRDLDPERVCVICTGSQGEPRSALTLMAAGEHRSLTIGENDTIVFSSHPIPGNEAAVSRVRNGLARAGAEIVHSGQLDIHTTGHGKQHELALLHAVASPELFVPVHGEFAHLVAHAALARRLGMDDSRIQVCEDGDQVVLSDDGLEVKGGVAGHHVYVDANGRPVGDDLLDERRSLAGEGFVLIMVAVDAVQKLLLRDPVIRSRGWVDADERDKLHEQCAHAVRAAVEDGLADGVVDEERLAQLARRGAGKFVSDVTRRRPVLLPEVTLV